MEIIIINSMSTIGKGANENTKNKKRMLWQIRKQSDFLEEYVKHGYSGYVGSLPRAGLCTL